MGLIYMTTEPTSTAWHYLCHFVTQTVLRESTASLSECYFWFSICDNVMLKF